MTEIPDAVQQISVWLKIRCRYALRHCSDGNVHIDILKDDRTQEDKKCPENQGESTLVYQLGGRLRRTRHWLQREALLEKYTDPVELSMMKAVKKALDPKNIMNPGKVVSINDEVPVEE